MGRRPPYHYPVFILTHHPRDPVEMEGGTTFHFVTDGIESALEQARDAAGGKDVMLWGGAQVANQYLAAGLLNELELHVVPVLLGDGARLFDDVEAAEVQLEQVRAVEAPGVTHLKYTVLTGRALAEKPGALWSDRASKQQAPVRKLFFEQRVRVIRSASPVIVAPCMAWIHAGRNCSIWRTTARTESSWAKIPYIGRPRASA